MPALAFLIGLAVALFLLAFITKRRFGVLGLALAAGALLSANWASTLTPFVADLGVEITMPPLATLVAMALILLPPLILLFSGPTTDSTVVRVIGSAAFAVLAIAFLINPLGQALRLEGPSLAVYSYVKTYHSMFVVAGLVAAIADLLFVRAHAPKKK